MKAISTELAKSALFRVMKFKDPIVTMQVIWKQRRSNTVTCTIYLYCDFHTFLYYVSRELNVINSGTVTLAMTVKADKLPRVTCFMLFYTDLVSHDVHSCR